MQSKIQSNLASSENPSESLSDGDEESINKTPNSDLSNSVRDINDFNIRTPSGDASVLRRKSILKAQFLSSKDSKKIVSTITNMKK